MYGTIERNNKLNLSYFTEDYLGATFPFPNPKLKTLNSGFYFLLLSSTKPFAQNHKTLYTSFYFPSVSSVPYETTRKDSPLTLNPKPSTLNPGSSPKWNAEAARFRGAAMLATVERPRSLQQDLCGQGGLHWRM